METLDLFFKKTRYHWNASHSTGKWREKSCRKLWGLQVCFCSYFVQFIKRSQGTGKKWSNVTVRSKGRGFYGRRICSRSSTRPPVRERTSLQYSWNMSGVPSTVYSPRAYLSKSLGLVRNRLSSEMRREAEISSWCSNSKLIQYGYSTVGERGGVQVGWWRPYACTQPSTCL
jgi:hypothetical protein